MMQEVLKMYPQATIFRIGNKYRIENRLKKRNNPTLSKWCNTPEAAWEDALKRIDVKSNHAHENSA